MCVRVAVGVAVVVAVPDDVRVRVTVREIVGLPESVNVAAFVEL